MGIGYWDLGIETMGKTNEKQLYGLIGYPVKHSYSALMHNAAFKHYGMDAEYQLFEVAPEKLDEFFKKTIREKKILGFNVTVPHKEKVVEYLDSKKDSLVETIGAVNTVRVEPNGALSGYNTDSEGFDRDLEEQGVAIADKNVCLLGAGGGAKAVAFAIMDKHPKKLSIFDIDPAKTQELVKRIKRFYPTDVFEVVGRIEDLEIAKADILINATPVGMKESDPLLVKQEWLHQNLFVYDLIYNPSETKLLKMAKEAGCKYANGLGMLLYQGVLAFQHWTDKKAPVEVMRKALLERISAGGGCR